MSGLMDGGEWVDLLIGGWWMANLVDCVGGSMGLVSD